MKKVSVIIPMYNSERYIRQCIASVTAQAYRDLEIIVVDDGSTDNGAAACKKLAEADGRIRLFRKENGGVSSARNYGIGIATGEYLFFMDSDDALHPMYLEEAVRQMEEQHADMAFFGFSRLNDEQIDEALSKAAAQDKRPQWQIAEGARKDEYVHLKYTRELLKIGGVARRACIGDIRFDENLPNGEDTLFMYRLLSGQVRMAYAPSKWYYYRINAGSATSSPNLAKGERYFESARRIRDSEYGKGHAEYAMRWETLLTDQIRRSYAAQKAWGAGKADKARETGKGGEAREAGRTRLELKKIAAAEIRHPLFRRLHFSNRVLFRCCFACYPLYSILNGITLGIVKRRGR